MNGYQIFLAVVFVLWPLMIGGLLYFMNKLEAYVQKVDADSPEEAGLEPVEGETPEREVRIVFGGKVVGESDG